jgi:hypothetical protein
MLLIVSEILHRFPSIGQIIDDLVIVKLSDRIGGQNKSRTNRDRRKVDFTHVNVFLLNINHDRIFHRLRNELENQ